MTREKIAVSLPAELVRAMKRAVRGGRARSVSAYVAEAIEEKERNDDLAILLSEMLAATGGPLTEQERVQIDRELDGPLDHGG